MLMISREPRRIMEGATARETRKTLLRLVSRTRSQSASDFSWAGPKRPIPALLTRMVMGPSAASVLATRSAISAGFVMLAICSCTGPPSFASARAESSRAVRSRPQIETDAPSNANCCAIARPIPRLPPVTSATLPASGFFSRACSFVLLIRAMRILPRTGHSFCATLILSLEISATLGIPWFRNEAGEAKAQKATTAEYHAEQACAAERTPAPLLKCLDDFVAKYPNSDLLSYIYPLYYQAYSAQKNYAKMIESADKLAGLGDKIDALTRFNAYFTHATAYYAMVSDPVAGPNASKDVAQAKAAQAAAASALKTLDEVKKPENVTDAVWKEQMTKTQLTLNGIAAPAAMT